MSSVRMLSEDVLRAGKLWATATGLLLPWTTATTQLELNNDKHVKTSVSLHRHIWFNCYIAIV